MRTIEQLAEEICKGSRLWDTLDADERKGCIEHTVRLLEGLEESGVVMKK